MKDWIRIVLAVLLCVIAVGGITVLLKDVEPNQEESSVAESADDSFPMEIEFNEESLIF